MPVNESTLRSNSILEIPVISRIRRNHGLEHATLHILSERKRNTNMAGHSDPGGFWVLGDFSLEEVQEAVDEALTRMRNGEHDLAVHRNCGTNYVTAGMLAGLVAGASMLGAGSRVRDKVERLPMAMVLATLALIAGQPLGRKIQQNITTCGDPGDLEIVEIASTNRGGMKAYRVTTRG
ncbi:MAG TPA: DUF6391 domain-containing protein [Anaerolineales bacterium]|nr:DUF6391 domain-containing protein [Anaerolineales bacterium]